MAFDTFRDAMTGQPILVNTTAVRAATRITDEETRLHFDKDHHVTVRANIDECLSKLR